MVATIKEYEIIVAPIITEATMNLVEQENKYTFKVAKDANKIEIKKAIEAIFGVKVVSVNTITVLPKFKRMGKHEGFKPGYKKAVVALLAGNKIDIFTS